MSGAAQAPGSSGAQSARDESPYLWMVLTTPVLNLLRGRVTGPIHKHKMAREAIVIVNLPPALGALAQDVAQRTRLWRSERREIVRELSAHFADDLDAGRSADELVADFGDPAQAAKLLRRAAKRNRRWPWQAMRFTVRGIGAAFGVLLLAYGYLAVRYYSSSPGPIADLRPQLNAIALNTPDDDKAWPLYREALLLKSGESIEKVRIDHHLSRMPVPGEPEWADVEAYLRRNARMLELTRQAAAKPSLGLVVGYDYSAEDAKALQMVPPPPVGDLTSPDDDGLIGVLLPHLAYLRELGVALAYDAQRAADDGDGATALANVNAMLGIAGHVRETPLLIADLVGIAVFARACETTNGILAQTPGVFSNADLIALAHRLASFDDAGLKCRLDGERLFFEDVLQRIYTDDGNGDGRLTPRGIRWLAILGNVWQPRPQPELDADALLGVTGPALSAIVLGRKDMAAEYDRLMNMNQRDADSPLWERDSPQSEQILQAWLASPIERIRHEPLTLLLPALSKATVNAEFAMMRRDATLTAIALEMYRRSNGRWPATLSALTPQWLPALPIDRFDGRPLRYAVRDDRPLLYSVGTDREDDGGTPPAAGAAHAQAWYPKSQVQALMKSQKPIPAATGGPVLYLDGDWILWPPPPEPPLWRDEQTTAPNKQSPPAAHAQ